MNDNTTMTEKEKQDIIFKNYDKLNNLNVPIKKSRFPLIDGIQQKVTLISRVTGRFKNIYFVKGVENTINGAIADDLLDSFPDMFKIYKVNGKLADKGKEYETKLKIKQDILEDLKEEFDIIPKKTKSTKRSRPEEKKLYKKSKYTKV